MAAIAGRLAELWLGTGAADGTLTKQACEAVTTTIYHVTDAAKRYLDPATAILVYVNDVLQTSGYHIGGGCQIHFNSAPGATVTLSGGYITPAEVTLVQNWSLDIQSEVYDITSLGGTARTYLGSGITAWSGSFERFYEDDTNKLLAEANGTKIIGRFFVDQPSGYCWTGWISPVNWGLNAPLELERETLSFAGDGECVYTTDEG
jgi:hypothetical protein